MLLRHSQHLPPPPPPSREALNALDFGAKGDCYYSATKPAWQVCSDDGPQLQAAIDAAQLQRRALYVPAGSYGINSSLIIHSNANSSDGYKYGPLRLLGEGKVLTSIQALRPMLAVLNLPMAKDKPPAYAHPHEVANSLPPPTGKLALVHVLLALGDLSLCAGLQGIEIEHISLQADSHADYCFHAPAIARSRLANINAGGAKKVAILMAYGWINRFCSNHLFSVLIGPEANQTTHQRLPFLLMF